MRNCLVVIFFIFPAIVIKGESCFEFLFKNLPDYYIVENESEEGGSIEKTFFSGSVKSLDGKTELDVRVVKDSVIYSVTKNNKSVINDSPLKLELTTGNIMTGLKVIRDSLVEFKGKRDLLVGERSYVNYEYKELIILLKNNKGLKFNIVFRVYDTGIAFRYEFPDDNSVSDIKVSKEYSTFVLSKESKAYQEIRNEAGYNYRLINGLNSLIPLTVMRDSFFLCINEACNDSYARIKLTGKDNLLSSDFMGSRANHKLPYNLPWRYVVISESPEELVENKEMLYSFDDASYDPKDWSWVKPGDVFMCGRTAKQTDSIMAAIDFCKDMNIRYVLIDAGWYGLGYKDKGESNSKSDPMVPVEAIDMPKVTSYAKEKSIGMIIYINKVGWYHYNNDKMFELYEKWGIKGLKLGFMDGYSANGISRIYKIISNAAKHKMFVNVHDNFRPTGLIHKYPNLLTAEGVRGNEHREHNGDHSTLIPFTRMLTGSTDYTICYPGSNEKFNKDKLKLIPTRGAQLALSVINYSPLQHVMWYGSPYMYKSSVGCDLFKTLPTVWDDFKCINCELGNYVSYARKKGDIWYLAALNDSKERNITIPLSFLNLKNNYKLTYYRDGEKDNVVKSVLDYRELLKQHIITDDKLVLTLKSNGGEVVVFEPEQCSVFKRIGYRIWRIWHS